ncbi:MAG: hypothetical protein AAF296_13855, partial [Pseudomonadota bacterium]
MILDTKLCEYLGHVVVGIGALGFAGATATTAGMIATGGIGAGALAGMFFAHRKLKKDKEFVEDDKVLKRIIEDTAKAWSEGRTDAFPDDPDRREYVAPDDIKAAQKALAHYLPDCEFGVENLAKSATSGAPFPEVATHEVLTCLSQKAPHLYSTDPDSQDVHTRFARFVVSAAFNSALTNQAYFARFEPYLLIEMARTDGQILSKVSALTGQLAAAMAVLDEVRDDVKKTKAQVGEVVALNEEQTGLLKQILANQIQQASAAGDAPPSPEALASFEDGIRAILASNEPRKKPAQALLAENDPEGAADALMSAGRQGMAQIQDALKQEASFFKEAGELYLLTAPSKALDAFRQATALDASDFWSLIYLSRLEDRHAGNLTAALGAADAAEQAASGSREQATAFLEQADVLIKLGRLEDAASAFKKGTDQFR